MASASALVGLFEPRNSTAPKCERALIADQIRAEMHFFIRLNQLMEKIFERVFRRMLERSFQYSRKIDLGKPQTCKSEVYPKRHDSPLEPAPRARRERKPGVRSMIAKHYSQSNRLPSGGHVVNRIWGFLFCQNFSVIMDLTLYF